MSGFFNLNFFKKNKKNVDVYGDSKASDHLLLLF